MVERIKKLFKKKNKEEKNNSFGNYLTMHHKVNFLENENEILKEQIKSRLFDIFMEKVGEPDKINRLEKENYRLRKQNKKLKEKLRNSLL